MRSACPCCLTPILADEFHFLSSSKNVVNVVVGMKGGKNWLCQNRTILHDICEISVISINRHYTTVNHGKVKISDKKKENQPKTIKGTFRSKLHVTKQNMYLYLLST